MIMRIPCPNPPFATKPNTCRLDSTGPRLTVNVHRIDRSRQHGELPTAACPGELLLPHSRIVDESREILIIRRPQSQLIIHADTPTIRLPRRVDEDTMVHTRSGERGVPNIRDRGRLGDDAGFPALRGGVVDDVFRRDVCQVQAGLLAIDTAEGKGRAGLCDCNGVMLAPTDVSDGVIGVVEGVDFGGNIYSGVVLASAFRNAGGAKCVESPGPDIAVDVLGERVVVASEDGLVFSATGAEEFWDEACAAFDVDTLIDVMTQLILLAASPDIDHAFASECHAVIRASLDVDSIRYLFI